MQIPSMRVDGKVALITGAGSGMGQSSALALALAGDDVAANVKTIDDDRCPGLVAGGLDSQNRCHDTYCRDGWVAAARAL